MTIHRMSVHQTLILSFLNFKKTPKEFLNGFITITSILNVEKSNLIVATKENLELEVSCCSIRIEDSVKLLGIYINNKLNFDYHVNQLCKKASKKLHALARIAKYMDINKQRMLMKVFVSSEFSYCPLTWMFHSRKMQHRINSIQKRTLKWVYLNFHELTFQELLPKDKSARVHQKKTLVASNWDM